MKDFTHWADKMNEILAWNKFTFESIQEYYGSCWRKSAIFVNSHLNPLCNGIVISINTGVDVIFEVLGCRNQSWSFKESLREVDSLKK